MPTDEADEVQIASFITIAGIPFSKYRNALFGAVHLAAIVAYMVRNNMCANAAIAAFWADIGLDPKKEIKKKSKNKVRFPTDQWVFRLFGSMSPEQLEERCDLMLDAQMKVARGAGIMTEAVIDIIDIHNIAHYGKSKGKHVIRTKSKDGASKAESYATALTTSGDYPYCTAATRVVDKRTKGDIVSKLLDDRARRGIRAALTLLDRGFFTVAVMKAFAKRGQLFVMGATRTAAVKRAVDEYIAGARGAISRCTIRSKKDSFEFTLVIVEKIEVNDGKEETVHVLYATNLPDKVLRAPGFDIDELYDKRWDIETHYRKLEEVRPRTVSRDHGSRTFFFFMGAVLLNMWAMYNQRQKWMIEEKKEKENAAAADASVGERAGEPAPPTPPLHPAARGEKEEEEEEGESAGGEGDGKPLEEEEEEEEEAPCPEPCGHGGEGDNDDDGDAPDCDEIVRLAVRVQNRPKRKYYKISKIFLIGIAARFRSIMLSWRYERGKFGRMIERFLASLAAAPT